MDRLGRAVEVAKLAVEVAKVPQRAVEVAKVVPSTAAAPSPGKASKSTNPFQRVSFHEERTQSADEVVILSDVSDVSDDSIMDGRRSAPPSLPMALRVTPPPMLLDTADIDGELSIAAQRSTSSSEGSNCRALDRIRREAERSRATRENMKREQRDRRWGGRKERR